MPDSPIIQGNKIDLVSVSVTVGGSEIPGEYDLIDVEVRKELNRVPTATVVVLDGYGPKVNFDISEADTFEPGKEIEISAGYHQSNEVIFKGIIIAQNVKLKHDELSSLEIKCVDKAAAMTVDRKNLYFKDSKDSDAITSVIGNHSGLTPDVTATSYVHERMIQYFSTDWDFMLTRAEANGYIVAVDDGKITVGYPKATEAALLKLTHGTDILKVDLEMDARHQYPGVKAEGWDYSKNEVVTAEVTSAPGVAQQGNLDSKKLSGVLGAKEYRLHTSGPEDKAMLTNWAEGRLYMSHMSRIRGKIKFAGNHMPKPDTTIEIEGLGARFDGTAYVSGVYHRIREHDWETEVTIGMSPHPFSETQADITAPAGSGLLPGVTGLQVGVVKDIHTDPLNEIRVLVDVPTIIPSGDGIWARQATFYATNDAGIFFQPEIGDEVILGFLNDDIRNPIILGSVYSKKHMVHNLYAPDEPNTYKAIVTNSHMRIEFEDVKRILTIWTPNENYIEINDDAGTITIEDENKNKVVMSSAGIDMYTPKDFIVKADGNISMEAGKNVDVVAGMNLTVEGGTNVTSTAGAANKMEGKNAEVSGSVATNIKGGMVNIN